jgi:hypothetical protein
MDPLVERVLRLPRELRDTIYFFIIEPDRAAPGAPALGWPEMSHPWPFIVPFEPDGNALWQELQDAFYARTVFYFVAEPDAGFRNVRLPRATDGGSDGGGGGGGGGIVRHPCRVGGMPNRFDFYRRPNWFSRIVHAKVAVTVPSLACAATDPPGSDSEAREDAAPALLRIPGRDLACKSGPHYVAVAKAAWLMQHAVSLRDLTVSVTVLDPAEPARRWPRPPPIERAEEWWGLVEPFVIFKHAVKLVCVYRKTKSTTVGIIFSTEDWCSDFHVGYNRPTSVIRRCPDPIFELLPGNHWGSYISIEGACPCGRSYKEISSPTWKKRGSYLDE